MNATRGTCEGGGRKAGQVRNEPETGGEASKKGGRKKEKKRKRREQCKKKRIKIRAENRENNKVQGGLAVKRSYELKHVCMQALRGRSVS